MDRMMKLKPDEFETLIVALAAAQEKYGGWTEVQRYNAAIDLETINALTRRFTEDRYMADGLQSESESMFYARLVRQALAAAAASQAPAPPPDPAVSSRANTAEWFRYATKSDQRKIERVAERLRAILKRDRADGYFVGVVDYAIRAVIEALELGDLFYEYPNRRSDP